MLEDPTYTSFMAVMIVVIVFGIIAIVKMTAVTKKLEEKNRLEKARRDQSAQPG